MGESMTYSFPVEFGLIFDTGCLCWNGRLTNARLWGRGYKTNINVRFSNYVIIQCCGNSRLIGKFRSPNNKNKWFLVAEWRNIDKQEASASVGGSN